MCCELPDYTDLYVQQELVRNLSLQAGEHKITTEVAIARIANTLNIENPVVAYLKAAVVNSQGGITREIDNQPDAF